MSEEPSTDGPSRSATAESDNLLDTIPTEVLAEFDAWIDAELSLLVARWAHAASPNAHRSRGCGLRV